MPWMLQLFAALIIFPSAHALPAKPKLIVVLVIDQFRSDYLTRFESRFLASKQANGKIGGFRYLMENGAYYPQAEHGVLHNMTCPGHAAILSGAYPYQNGIPANEWFDREKNRTVYCVEDHDVATVGSVPRDPQPGTSPKYLVGTTFGDELKNAGYKSKVFTVSLKDRAAILLGGHRADLALWFDPDAFRWVSSKYYLSNDRLPDWVNKLNLEISKEKKGPLTWLAQGEGSGRSTRIASNEKTFVVSDGFEVKHETQIGTITSLSYPYGVEKTVEAAKAILSNNKLGHGQDPDLLAISFSTHDFLGHHYGPNAREMEEITVAEDRQISEFLNFVEKNVGLKNTVIVLTADHGVGGNPEWLNHAGVPSERIDIKSFHTTINDFLNKKYKKPASGEWVSEIYELNIYLNKKAIHEAQLKSEVVEKEVAEFIMNSAKMNKGIAYAFTATDVASRKLPPGIHETQILHTFYPGRSGDVTLILKPDVIVGTVPATHMTGYSYDRKVPIILAGQRIRKGQYGNPAQVIDIAPTLAFLTGVIPPSGSEGRVLFESVK